MANPIPTKTSWKAGESGNPEGKKSRTPVRDCFYRLNAQSDGQMVRDVCEIGTHTLAAALNELGGEGWELIMNSYHHGELLCIWKRPRDKS